MRISRRDFLAQSAVLAGSALTRDAFAAFQPWMQNLEAGAAGIPEMSVQDFSRKFDPAYLSNGLLGIRPGPNPLAPALACLGGFVMKDETYLMEILAPAPYPLAMDIRIGGTSSLETPESLKTILQTLYFATGELVTDMVFTPGNGASLRLQVVQFASRSVPSLLCQEITATASADVEVTFTGSIATKGTLGTAYLSAPPGMSKVELAVGFASAGGVSKMGASAAILTPGSAMQRDTATDAGKASHPCRARLLTGTPLRVHTIAAMVSDVYHPEPELEAIRLASWGAMLGFEELRAKNREAWSGLWQSRVKITGDNEDQKLLDAAFFYLHSSLHASTRTGMAPYGLSQFRNYFGHSFWDTESWSFLPIVLATPETARALLEFRLRSLEAARRRAALFGYRGLQFPWEASQSGGFETTPTCCDTGWVEQHSTPDVALAFWEYQLATGDTDFLKTGTWPALHGVAEWLESRGIFTNRGFEIHHIEGPDEGTPNINNSSYMNLVSKMVLDSAIRCASLAGAKAPASWARMRDAMVLPIDSARKFVLPYDQPPQMGDTHYSAGGLDLLTVHDAPISLELLRNTHNNEQAVRAPSPDDVGFAVAGMATTAAFLGEKQRAKQLFDASWKNVWLEPFGLIRERPAHDYGCFLTNFGSLLQAAMLGFTGLRVNEGNWAKYPASLPEGWRSIEIERIWVRGEAKRMVARDGVPAKLL